jgi:hypothetical protein
MQCGIEFSFEAPNLLHPALGTSDPRQLDTNGKPYLATSSVVYIRKQQRAALYNIAVLVFLMPDKVP